eukprot:TRINITY_DN30997_c0_g1_i1.p1 TRINITY_DN30997_c0_g1~~TRINITY_DN30997_c0_g1_i1.p1  ORF type:complete len:272 (-),score=49.05 TRINITY_DN30997_c0_g1_i1:27-842(-)
MESEGGRGGTLSNPDGFADETSPHDLPPMMRPLDVVLPTPEEVRDIAIIKRELPDDKGTFEALHNVQLSNSLMSGCYESSISTGGVSRYEGTFLNKDPKQELPMPSGQGIRTNADGSTYAGQWKDGFPHGDGEWQAPPPSTESYIGEWKRGKKHGFGVQHFQNGDLYEGDWMDGKFQDRGKYVYANGDEFMGTFDKGLKVAGTFYFTDGRTSNRKWVNGVLVTCQDFDSRRGRYQTTVHKDDVHAQGSLRYGDPALRSSFGVVSPRGIRIN